MIAELYEAMSRNTFDHPHHEATLDVPIQSSTLRASKSFAFGFDHARRGDWLL